MAKKIIIDGKEYEDVSLEFLEPLKTRLEREKKQRFLNVQEAAKRTKKIQEEATENYRRQRYPEKNISKILNSDGMVPSEHETEQPEVNEYDTSLVNRNGQYHESQKSNPYYLNYFRELSRTEGRPIPLSVARLKHMSKFRNLSLEDRMDLKHEGVFIDLRGRHASQTKRKYGSVYVRVSNTDLDYKLRLGGMGYLFFNRYVQNLLKGIQKPTPSDLKSKDEVAYRVAEERCALRRLINDGVLFENK